MDWWIEGTDPYIPRACIQAGYTDLVRLIMKVYERLGKCYKSHLGPGIRRKHRRCLMFPGDFKTWAKLWERKNCLQSVTFRKPLPFGNPAI
jgi:hypothetical protein